MDASGRWRHAGADPSDPLGIIKWFGRWRQYAFQPEPNTTFNPGCLDTINANIRWLMARRRQDDPVKGENQ